MSYSNPFSCCHSCSVMFPRVDELPRCPKCGEVTLLWGQLDSKDGGFVDDYCPKPIEMPEVR